MKTKIVSFVPYKHSCYHKLDNYTQNRLVVDPTLFPRFQRKYWKTEITAISTYLDHICRRSNYTGQAN